MEIMHLFLLVGIMQAGVVVVVQIRLLVAFPFPFCDLVVAERIAFPFGITVIHVEAGEVVVESGFRLPAVEFRRQQVIPVSDKGMVGFGVDDAPAFPGFRHVIDDYPSSPRLSKPAARKRACWLPALKRGAVLSFLSYAEVFGGAFLCAGRVATGFTKFPSIRRCCRLGC